MLRSSTTRGRMQLNMNCKEYHLLFVSFLINWHNLVEKLETSVAPYGSQLYTRPQKLGLSQHKYTQPAPNTPNFVVVKGMRTR